MTAHLGDIDNEPVKVQVTRWRCPFCGRSHSGRGRARDHVARCWLNPAARSCKTCAFHDFDWDEPDVGYVGKGDICHEDVELPVDGRGRPTLAVGCPEWKLSLSVVAS